MKFAITDLTADQLAICMAALKVTGSPVSVQTSEPATTTAPAGDTGSDLDDRGVPHNIDFHAPGKGKTKAGNWARKKGVDAASCDAYEAQFTGKAAAHAPGVPSLSLPPALTLPAATPAYPPATWNEFVNLYSPMASEGAISADDIDRMLTEAGAQTGQAGLIELQTNDRARAHVFGLLSVVKASGKK